jgi:F420-non-reducing hydrogenase iron-sulfur subunit
VATKLVLDDLGIDPARYEVEWVSSAEAPQFAEIVRNFVGKIRALGPNPCRPVQASAA